MLALDNNKKGRTNTLAVNAKVRRQKGDERGEGWGEQLLEVGEGEEEEAAPPAAVVKVKIAKNYLEANVKLKSLSNNNNSKKLPHMQPTRRCDDSTPTLTRNGVWHLTPFAAGWPASQAVSR